MVTILLKNKTPGVKISCPEKANVIKYNENELILKISIFKDVKWYKTTFLLLFRGKNRLPTAMLYNVSRDKQKNPCKIHKESHQEKKSIKKKFNSTLKEIAGFPFMFYYTLL